MIVLSASASDAFMLPGWCCTPAYGLLALIELCCCAAKTMTLILNTVFAARLKISTIQSSEKVKHTQSYSLCVTVHQWGKDVGIGILNSASSCWVDPIWSKNLAEGLFHVHICALAAQSVWKTKECTWK